MGSRILVVDDEKKACANLRKFLEKKQFEVGIAHNGLEALDLLEEFQPDCILLDIRMPDLNGVECLKRIKSRLPDAQI
ncbi:MAG: response regulator, partial [Nitrospinaceae bacterium]|nr:response regulator [Nitrospinaceae bacterium]